LNLGGFRGHENSGERSENNMYILKWNI